MSAFIVWMDHENAKLFKLSGTGNETKTMKLHEHKHHTTGDVDKNKHQSEKFFHEIAGKLNDAKEILLIGPGTAKTQFKHHLDNHHHANLAKHVVGVETVDHPTEKELLAAARKFFKKYDLFAG